MFKKVDDKMICFFCLQQPPPARGRWQTGSCWLEAEGDYFEKGQVEDQTRGGVGAESCWRLIWTLLHRCSPLASLQFTKVQFRQQHHPIRIVSHCHQTSLDDNKKKPNQTFLKTAIRYMFGALFKGRSYISKITVFASQFYSFHRTVPCLPL